MSVLDKFLDAIRLNDDYEEEDADSIASSMKKTMI